MATWDDLGWESLRSAKSMKSLGCLRSCISRSYYAAYAFATGSLERSGVDVSVGGRFNPGHDQLLRLVEHNLGRIASESGKGSQLARRMRTLRRFRLMADYDPKSYVDLGLAVVCLRDASIVASELGKEPEQW